MTTDPRALPVIRHPDCQIGTAYYSMHGMTTWKPGDEDATLHPPAIYASPNDPRTDDELRAIFSGAWEGR